jgi:hypothetical protein
MLERAAVEVKIAIKVHPHCGFPQRSVAPLSSDAQFFSNLEDPPPVLSSQCRANNILRRFINLGPSKLLPFCLGPGEARSNTLLDHRPLKLSKDTRHLEHGLAGRRRGGVATQPIELRAFVSTLGSADAVVTIDLDYLAPHSGGDLPELALLVRGRLVERRHAQIGAQTFGDAALRSLIVISRL